MQSSILKIIFILSASILWASCIKKETPYPAPPLNTSDSTKTGKVSLGEDYQTQVYYSLENGEIASNTYSSWDINFTSAISNSEVRMNGGNLVLLYPTNETNLANVTSTSGFSANNWKYDDPSGLPGTSGLGYLENNPVLGKVIVIAQNNTFSKFIINSISATSYTITVANNLAATSGTSYTLLKDDAYNFIYFKVGEGEVKPEPKKTEWDIVFTKYRYIYRAYNPDGSDFLYSVAGVLLNPYQTEGASDSTKWFNYNDFTLETLANEYIMVKNRDVIGFNWKIVNINTAKYVIEPRRIYVIKDQQDKIWKMHFFGFLDEQGRNGTPQFRYEILK